MYLLKKVIQLREKSHPDHEKPFLEHLEDLRVIITRVVITLVISMIVCFAFNKQLMDFFRRPVEQVLVNQIQATLPEDAPRKLTVERWGEARKIEQAANHLSPEQREIFYQSLADSELVFHAKSASVLRAALLLPEEKRAPFVSSLKENDEFKKQVAALLKTKPKTDTDVNGNLRMMSALKPTEAFMLSMKLSFVAGIVISFPLLLLFILQFILPGLHAHEKRVLWPSLIIGFGLFLTGVSFAYFMVLPRALLFFAEWSGSMGISNDWRIGEYISFATQFTLLFGLSFELPVVVMVFVKLGLLTYDTMSKTRSYAILGIFIAAAVLTPTPDAFTLILMALPMIVLYEICIWLAYFDRKKQRAREEQESRERWSTCYGWKKSIRKITRLSLPKTSTGTTIIPPESGTKHPPMKRNFL
ncbi:MAG: twin-arginine translocase subunit TatC [Akkermansiaceae bacterium]|nr:twin-arginine translocase subunit TatC [Akkermansiaceae bacterium]